ncbi:hypothetical protein DL770_010212 [Monosporascus sp. CRB-9-2]|nr:hypothetical protein DL770_010212 [Monosporascus sp. CRB-9-2]
MRLLHTKVSDTGVFEIQEFGDDEIPEYAILSHTWDEGEVTFQDMEGTHARNKEGYEKVKMCCSLARDDGFDYVWMDTCCIDKTSSAELSEAINSMYLWYQNAKLCYAYLADVSSDTVNHPASFTDSEFSRSKWFKRGWTLQELIAPPELIFLNRKWQKVGTKSTLQQDIFKTTGIPVGILSGSDDLETASVAQRMSWAANRETSRLEDLAYCLMGIFGVNMPLIYGEGRRAFLRLQEEIMKISDDHSIFAWKSKDDTHGGLLATSPEAFKSSANIRRLTTARTSNDLKKYDHMFARAGEHLTVWLLYTATSAEEINRKDIQGRTKLSYTAGEGDVEAVWLLLTRSEVQADSEDNFGRTPLSYAAANGHEAIVKLLLNTGKVGADWRDNQNVTPLSYAAANGHDAIVKVLLDTGMVSPDSRGHSGRTALLYAAANGYEAIVKLLLNTGKVRADTKDDDNRTPLSYAAEKGHEAIVKQLLNTGEVNADSEDRFDRTPLSYAAKKGHQAIVSWLLNTGKVKADSKDELGQTPLSHAAEEGQEAIVTLLLNTGEVEGDSRDWFNQTPLFYAARSGHEGIVRLLLNTGEVKVDSKNDANQTPLSCATKEGHEDIVKLLLDNGSANAYSFARWFNTSRIPLFSDTVAED